uniref:Uncharacterized protein n=1 Tax=viral metagenome TaxID=1070528 RepID=A0A6C0JF91_9ZZZZ
MVSQDQFFRIVGLAVIFLLLLSGAVKMLSYKKQVIEGMANNSKLEQLAEENLENAAKKIEARAEKINDQMLVDKYRSSYEDIITNLYDVVSSSLVLDITYASDAISKDPMSNTSTKLIDKLNKLSSFRETLNQAILVLDKK